MDMVKEVFSPDFEEFDRLGKRVHNWRTYVTGGIRNNWNNLSVETRLAVIEVCEEVADAEEWN